MEANHQTFLEFRAYWQLSEETCASKLHNINRIVIIRQLCATKYRN